MLLYLIYFQTWTIPLTHFDYSKSILPSIALVQISHIIEEYGGIHMLVNNAGGQFVCNAEDMSTGGFAAVVDTNLKGTFLCCREAYTQYMRDHGGSIVNITLGNRNGMVGMKTLWQYKLF